LGDSILSTEDTEKHGQKILVNLVYPKILSVGAVSEQIYRTFQPNRNHAPIQEVSARALKKNEDNEAGWINGFIGLRSEIIRGFWR